MLRAVQPADELLKDGDMDGVVVWREITAAIEELRRGRQEGRVPELAAHSPVYGH